MARLCLCGRSAGVQTGISFRRRLRRQSCAESAVLMSHRPAGAPELRASSEIDDAITGSGCRVDFQMISAGWPYEPVVEKKLK